MTLSERSLTPKRFSRAIFMALLVPGIGIGSSPILAQSQQSCPLPGALTQGFQGPMAHVRYLSDDALEGREVSTPGARCSADYIADYFRELGLEGAGPEGSFFQTFQVQMGGVLGSENSLEVNGDALELSSGWVPFGFSGSGTVSASLIYGGPGVSMPGSEDDAYAHLDLTGKIVVVEGSAASNAMANPHFKASVAAGRDAAGIMILLPEGESLPNPGEEMHPGVKVPAVAIAGELAQEIRDAAKVGARAELIATVEPRLLEARNVAAMIPGSDPTLAREAMIVGAHYDHLGHGGDGSLAPDERQVHNGADDNASGTAALMEVARILQAAGEHPARSVLFLAFTGEEKGLWGSAHYVDNPIVPLENTIAMVNMDMVGRLRDNALTVYGTGTADEWPDLLEEVNQAQSQPFTLNSIPDGQGASDHSEFYQADLPVLMLFTNTHSEYHRPEDDWELINAQGLDRISTFAAELVGEVTGSGTIEAMAMTFIEGAGSPQMPSSSSGPGNGVYVGGIPDMTPQDFGVRITGTREGSPADKAGLKEGDIIVEFGGKEISDLYAYTYALREHKPGDEVVIVVLRDGERVSLTAILGSR